MILRSVLILAAALALVAVVAQLGAALFHVIEHGFQRDDIRRAARRRIRELAREAKAAGK